MEKVFWNESVMALVVGGGAVRLYQPHYRRNALVDLATLSVIDALATAGARGVALDALGAGPFVARDITDFSIYDHAYANADMAEADPEPLSDEDRLDRDEFVELLVECGFAGESRPIVYDHAKKGFADRFKGSFYEQIGTEALLNREQPTEWWTKQKFEADLKSIRPTAYRFVEQHFLDGYLAEGCAGKDVVEIGCGTGYFTNRMAQTAAHAVGLDYNADYIEKARATWADVGERSADYAVCDIIDFSGERPELLDRKYDRVMLIDTFLFLFHPSYQPVLYENRETVIRNMRRLVKDDGRLMVMDPHPLWLTPYFGSDDRPFGVLESYKNHHFKVIPTLEEVTALFEKARVAVTRIYEPGPSAEMKDVDPKGFAHYSEIPPWWVFELTPY
ncbi:MAG: class I SAM-dependent methyltransferase [Parvularculaceae bacterium]